MRPALLAFTLLAVGAPPMARAERVGVAAVHGAEAPMARPSLQKAVSEEWGGGIDPNPVATARLRRGRGAVRRARLNAFRRASTLEAEGKNAYYAADPGFAVARLGEARRVALEVADLPGGLALIARISLHLGAARLELGRPKDAAEDFALARRLDPSTGDLAAQLKPVVSGAWRRAVETAGVRLDVSVVPGGAVVRVNGLRHHGAAPPGLHLVTATGEGFRPHGELARAPGRVVVRLIPEPPRAFTFHAGMPPTAIEAMGAAVVEFAELDALVMVASHWRGSLAAVSGELCRGVPLLCTRPVEIRYATGRRAHAIASLVRSLRAAPVVATPSLFADESMLLAKRGRAPQKNKVSPRWYQNRWLWVGAAAASLVGGSMVLLAQPDDPHTVFEIDDGFVR